jgi:hypothetical protein
MEYIKIEEGSESEKLEKVIRGLVKLEALLREQEAMRKYWRILGLIPSFRQAEEALLSQDREVLGNNF